MPPILVCSPVDISAGQWFVVHGHNEIELISDALAQALRPVPNGTEANDLTDGLRVQLQWLGQRVRPVAAGKHNSSGQLSKLKALGYAENQQGRWSITQAGREILNNG